MSEAELVQNWSNAAAGKFETRPWSVLFYTDDSSSNILHTNIYSATKRIIQCSVSVSAGSVVGCRSNSEALLFFSSVSDVLTKSK